MGKVVMPKNSAVEEEIKAALSIYYEADDWVKNSDFTEKLKRIIGADQYHSSYTKKVQMTSYFGFTEWEDFSNAQSRRRITESGKRFYSAWVADDKNRMLDEIVYAIEHTVFGRNNCGCSDSDSDIEIPSIFIRTLISMRYLTYTEFAYLLWKMEDCGLNYSDALEELRIARGQDNFLLPEEAKRYTDAKPIMMLIRWGLLKEEGKIGASNKIIIPQSVMAQYGERLKRIKIYNIDKFDDVLPVIDEISEMNEYELAAKRLSDFKEEQGIFVTESSDIEKARNDFLIRFSPDKLASLTDDNLLEFVFYTKGDNTNSLCCWIEMNKECRTYFGSIAGGSAYKFGLFQRQEDGSWQTGSSAKGTELTYSSALALGKEIRDALVKGCYIIEHAKLETIEDYEELDETLEHELNTGHVYYNWAWFHKYFSIIYSDKFSGFHSVDWQLHILRAMGIAPSEKYYARSGQIALVQKYGGWVYRQFFDIAYARYGGIRQFIRIGSSDDEKGYASEWRANSIVGIGWPKLGSLETFKDEDGRLDKNEIASRLQELYYGDDSKTASRKAGELIRFYETNADSIIVVMNGEQLVGFVDELGGYSFDDSSNMPHIKSGKWKVPFTSEDRMPNKGEGLLTSCVQIKDGNNLLYLYDKYYSDDEVDEENSEMEDIKLKNCLQVTREPRTDILHPMNFIIYGAPGTGKTYSTAEYALAIIEKREVDLGKKTIEQRKAVMAKYNELVRAGQIVFTTFHQSYGYEEFIQGLRPDTKSDKMSFKTVDGVFKHIADVALNDSDNNYVIIIDEINRANISKVFGELITLIEEDKRWGEVNETCATLQSGDVFAVPNNLYIVGTMNSADKSISLIDAALRRRFEFIEQKPNPELVDNAVLRAVLSKMNSKLADELDSSDLLIGHSYFMNKSEQTLPSILNNSIIPLLYEYFYDNKKKVASVLDYTIGDYDIEIVDDKLGRLNVKKKEG